MNVVNTFYNSLTPILHITVLNIGINGKFTYLKKRDTITISYQVTKNVEHVEQ